MHAVREHNRQWQLAYAEKRAHIDRTDMELAGARLDLRRAQDSLQERERLIARLTQSESRTHVEIVRECAALSQSEATIAGLQSRTV